MYSKLEVQYKLAIHIPNREVYGHDRIATARYGDALTIAYYDRGVGGGRREVSVTP